jgi:hypothetical protein
MTGLRRNYLIIVNNSSEPHELINVQSSSKMFGPGVLPVVGVNHFPFGRIKAPLPNPPIATMQYVKRTGHQN